MYKNFADLQLLVKAIDFAARKHSSQRRKNSTKSPYIEHPILVMKLLTDSGVTDVNTLCAAVLHDTVEDTETTFDELTTEFNEEIADIVREVTDDKSLSKVARKRGQIEHGPCGSLPSGRLPGSKPPEGPYNEPYVH